MTMIQRRTELNPAFKIAQPLPRLSSEPVAARGFALPFFGPRLVHRSVHGFQFAMAAQVRRAANDNDRVRP